MTNPMRPLKANSTAVRIAAMVPKDGPPEEHLYRDNRAEQRSAIIRRLVDAGMTHKRLDDPYVRASLRHIPSDVDPATWVAQCMETKPEWFGQDSPRSSSAHGLIADFMSGGTVQNR